MNKNKEKHDKHPIITIKKDLKDDLDVIKKYLESISEYDTYISYSKVISYLVKKYKGENI